MTIFDATREALYLVVSGDSYLWATILVSLRVSTFALLLTTPLAILLGFVMGNYRFPGRRALIVLVQTLLSFPTVVIGLLMYMLLSRNGPLGGWQLLFTQQGMMLAEAVLAFPILTAMTLAAVQGVDRRATETARTLGAKPMRVAFTTLLEVRFAVIAALVAGFGRIISEIGCALMVGGNIAGMTRTMTTSIALETSKGLFAEGIALGLVLIVVALGVNMLLNLLQGRGEQR
jgi:tungstate transport system permease protein